MRLLSYLKKSHSIFLGFTVSFFLLLSACGGEENSSREVIQDEKATVSFSDDVQAILNANCTVCHTTGGVASFMPLTEGEAYQNLVNVESEKTEGGEKRVLAFDAENSVLYQRVSGIGLSLSEATMPLGSPQLLPDEKINLIKNWIDEGALEN